MKSGSGHLKKLLALGESHLSQNRIAEAIDVLTDATRLAPRSIFAWINLGHAYLRVGKLDAAKDCFSKAMQLDENNASAVAGCAEALMALGEFDEAIELFERVISLDEKRAPSATASIAEALEKLGSSEEAYARLAPFVDLEDQSAAIVLSMSQLVLQHEQFATEQDKVIRLLREIAGCEQEEIVMRARAYFRLGHLYRKRKDYDSSFESYRSAHELVGDDYDLTELFNNIEQLKRNFSTSTSGPPSGGKFKNIFVLGLPRSGTSLIEKIVGVNPDVLSLGECNFFHHAVCEVSADKDVMWGSKAVEDADLQRVRMLYKQKYLVGNRLSSYVCDKSLENVFLVGQIMQVFPNAKLVWTRRDLRDVCLSCYASDFAGRHSYTHDLKVLGQYAKTIEALMLYWVERFPENIHVVNYEDFVVSPEEGIRELVGFLGFDWDDSYLNFHLSNNRVKTLSYNDVQKPVYQRAVGQWRNYEKWLTPLLDELTS